MQAFHGEPLVADPTSDDYFRCARCGRSTRIAATSGLVHLCVASDAGGARSSPKRPAEEAYHFEKSSFDDASWKAYEDEASDRDGNINRAGAFGYGGYRHKDEYDAADEQDSSMLAAAWRAEGSFDDGACSDRIALR